MQYDHPFGPEITVALANLTPVLQSGTYVFAAVFHNADAREALSLAIASFVEDEGLALVLPRTEAVRLGMIFDQTFHHITLMMPSAYNGPGLTAMVAEALARAEIPAQFVAATQHDHIFVPSRRSEAAMSVLRKLQADAQAALDAVGD